MRIFTAIRVFFRVLFNRGLADQVAQLLAGASVAPGPTAESKPASKPPAAPKPPSRSDAVTLLAALQREARLVDFIQESLAGYSDAEIGAAVRDVHRDCAKVIQRMFDLEPILADEEGAAVELPDGFDTGCYRLTGNVVGGGPFRGVMVHHGWRAKRCEVPQWSGSAESARVVAPAEIELK